MKIRQDFVSNSSSSSYIVTGMDSLDELKTVICDALSDDRDNKYNKKWYKELKKENLEKLNLYLPSTTAIFYDENITNPLGVSTNIINQFVKDGVIINEDKLKQFLDFINKKYVNYLDGYIDETEIDSEFEKKLEEDFNFRFIGTVTKDSIAILKWLKDHDKLFSKKRYIDTCKRALDNGHWTKEIYDKHVARADEFEKQNDDQYNRIINAFDDGKPMIYVLINRDGDGMDGDRLFAIGYIWYAQEKGLEIVCSEFF